MTKTNSRRERRHFNDKFKRQMVQLYQSGKKRGDIVREYDLTASSLDRWIKEMTTSGSLGAKNNRSAEENELIALRKQNRQLLMENDRLKQAALIMGRKSS